MSRTRALLLAVFLVAPWAFSAWWFYRPPAPGPAMRFDLAEPRLWAIGDDAFVVVLSLEPKEMVPNWWWGNNGGVAAIRIDGQDLLTVRGMPERWDVEGYEAPAKGVRLQPGVGWSSKKNEAAVPGPYPLGPQTIVVQDDAVTCVQELPPHGGYAYRMEKRIAVDPAARTLRMTWTVANTGEKPLTLRHFVHAYWNLGGGPIDGSYRIDTALRPKEAESLWREDAAGLVVAGPIAKASFADHAEQAPEVSAAWTMRNARTGLAVTVTGDFAPALFALYAEETAIIPELSARCAIAPGESASWSRTWRFSADERP